LLHVSVASVALPTISWRCPRCSCHEFVCAQRFRVNTNGKLADIWLIYRCAHCDATKNVTIVERTPVAKISRPLFEAAMENDESAARRLARDLAVLGRAGIRVARGDRFETNTVAVGVALDCECARLDFTEPLLVRLDAVVAAATGTSRSRLRTLERSGHIVIEPPRPLTRLRRQDSVTVSFDPSLRSRR
jgi:hypothetical protein